MPITVILWCMTPGPGEVEARAIVLHINRDLPGHLDGDGHIDADDRRLATYLLTLTVMADDEPPFRCKVNAELPIGDQWNVQVGTHVPVTIDGRHDVTVDTAAIEHLYSLD